MMTKPNEMSVDYKPLWRAMRIVSVSLAALFAAAILTQAAPAFAKTYKVTMTDTPARFQPEKLKIKTGDTVEWTNDAQTLHTVTADPAKAVDKSDVVLPKGAQPFDSGFLMPGKTFSHTFSTPGDYKYFCIPHEKDGMFGYITVTK